RPKFLVVGVVERLLIHVEKDQRPFRAGGLARMNIHDCETNATRPQRPYRQGQNTPLKTAYRSRTRVSYIRPRPRWVNALSRAGRPALAVCSSRLAIGISRATSARPFGLSPTTTSRLLVAERLRVTKPMRTSRLTNRDIVEASIEVMVTRSTW